MSSISETRRVRFDWLVVFVTALILLFTGGIVLTSPKITYVESSQGFTWNPEIFLPSYVDCDYTPLENRREPVVDILLSDEEAKNILPQ
jgi:hypothetical protein